MSNIRIILQLLFLSITIIAVFIIGGNAERWCPMGGIEGLYTYFSEGNLPCSLGISNFYILLAVIILTLLMRRIFCGYICPIGTISELFSRLGKKIGFTPKKIPYKIDRFFSLFKYIFLGIILYYTYRFGELWFRGVDPCYALISKHGEDIGIGAYILLGSIVLFSLFISLPFCRWLCPFAAVLNPFSRVGLCRIQRNSDTCIECHKCDKVCPMDIPVSQSSEVTHARCLSCLQCLNSCPVKDTLSWGPSKSSLILKLFSIFPFLGKSKLVSKFFQPWNRELLLALTMIIIASAVIAYELQPLPSFVQVRGEPSPEVSIISFPVENLTCRGRANLFVYFITRDDDYEITGYLKIEVWPSPGIAKCRISYDPKSTSPEQIKNAIIQPYFDMDSGIWRKSPFVIPGFSAN